VSTKLANFFAAFIDDASRANGKIAWIVLVTNTASDQKTMCDPILR
jgi:hypothetical protein